MLKSLFKNAMGATHGQVPARFPVDVERNHWKSGQPCSIRLPISFLDQRRTVLATFGRYDPGRLHT